IEQQQSRFTNQSLCKQQSLSLAPRHFRQWPLRKLGGVDSIERCVDAAVAVVAGKRKAPALAVERTGDKIAPAYTQIGQDGPQLRQIADLRISSLGRTAEYAQSSPRWRQEAKDRPHQGCFAGAIGPENA